MTSDQALEITDSQYTGGRLVLLDDQRLDSGLSSIRLATGIAASGQLAAHELGGTAIQDLEAGTTVFYEDLGAAVVYGDPDQIGALSVAAASAPAILLTEPERYVQAIETSTDYATGYADGTADLARRLGIASISAADLQDSLSTPQTFDESRTTWGLQAIRATESCLTGTGIGVAILDTGIAANHPDFVNRQVITANFVSGQDVDDRHGHGTHCAGTACGPKEPTSMPRYGVAGQAALHVGKVLNNSGRGTDGNILAGLDWALRNGCRVASMSLGSPTNPTDAYSQIYEQIAQRASRRGMLIVAAAGNNSSRPTQVRSVNHPANCPSILAIAAIGTDLQVARFSCAGLSIDGGQIDISAPGVDVLSASPGPSPYRRLSGTSMATPHVAGVLALLAQANPGAGSAELQSALIRYARRLNASSADTGAGLVQAP
jgi:subtilisin family serine protease